jgi:hypothetical protein
MPNRTGSFDHSPVNLRPPVLLLLVGLLFAIQALAVDKYDYMVRGDRYEGILAQPVSGDDIALISARAAPVGGFSGSVPKRMRLTFYLPEQEPVHVTVRELDNHHYYWMDKVLPPDPWRPRRTNSFHWPTRDVLQWLYGQGMKPDDLGAIVRLSETGAPSARERVAPALLSGDDRPVAVKSYLFTFKSNLPADLTCSLYADQGKNVLWSKDFHRVSAGRPFTCEVPLGALKEGDYRLEIDGKSLDKNAPVRQQVRFFHSPDLR